MKNTLSDTTNDPMKTVEETAMRLGISVRTLYREIQAKHFPRPVKIGGKSLFYASDAEIFLSSLKQQRDER